VSWRAVIPRPGADGKYDADDFSEVAVLRRDGSVAGDAAIVLQWLTDHMPTIVQLSQL
jgi:hypothetical protein